MSPWQFPTPATTRNNPKTRNIIIGPGPNTPAHKTNTQTNTQSTIPRPIEESTEKTPSNLLNELSSKKELSSSKFNYSKLQHCPQNFPGKKKKNKKSQLTVKLKPSHSEAKLASHIKIDFSKYEKE